LKREVLVFGRRKTATFLLGVKRTFWFVAFSILVSACEVVVTEKSALNVSDLTYVLEESPVVLGVNTIDGQAQLLMSAEGDLNGDGQLDYVALLQLNSQGTGVFYYLNVFVRDDSSRLKFVTETFLGDRIDIVALEVYGPQSVSSVSGVAIAEDDYGQILVAYRQHGATQSMSEKPRVFLTKHFLLSDENLVLVEQN